jgi:hypothetical protein
MKNQISASYGIKNELDIFFDYRILSSADSPGKIFSGIFTNISHSGKCLYVLNPVKIGQEITIKTNRKSTEGIVAWSLKPFINRKRRLSSSFVSR